MSNDIAPHTEAEDIEMLLPFYVMGRLDRGDAERIDECLVRHPDIADRLRLIREERAAVATANIAVTAFPAHDFERLAASVAMTPVRAPRPDGSLWDRIKRVFTIPASQSRAWIGAAAMLVMVVQGAAIATLVATRDSPNFATASGGRETTESGAIAVVRFAGNATTAAIADMLAELGMAIVDGPRSGGLFTVRIGPSKMSEAARDRALAELKMHGDLVSFATRLP